MLNCTILVGAWPGAAPACLEDGLAIGGGYEAPEGEAARGAALRQTGDGRSAGAVQGGQEGPLAHDRQPCVLMVQGCQQIACCTVPVPACYSYGALHSAAMSEPFSDAILQCSEYKIECGLRQATAK